ncbi:MAG TPA: efflux RND transporter periplasmic adaptor subunit [Nannocystis exedens]|nr:efflux RND transporter periplasmic adaptor subunit [Nannocystis exedens]
MSRRHHALLLALFVASGCQAASGGEAHGNRDNAGKHENKGKRGERGKRGKRGGDSKGKRGEQDALPVTVTHPTPATVERFYRTSGTLQALRRAELVATQSAVILEIRSEEGDRVKAGQVLARLDGRALSLQASAAKVTAKNAKAELRRLEAIAAMDAVSGEELDKQRYAVEQARASVKVSRHQVTQTKVIAPFAGTIVARYVDVGNMATQATPLFSIADMSKLDLELHIPEAEAGAVALNSAVDVELLDGSSFAATIIRRAPIVDSLTGTVKFVARADSFPDSAVPGAFARARVRVAAKEVSLSLPQSALFEYEGEPHVYVVVDGKATRVRPSVGLRGEQRFEITGDIENDATVIEDASRGITEGMPVRPLDVPEDRLTDKNKNKNKNKNKAGDRNEGR